MVKFSGVMPANVLPFKADLSIDEPAYRKHLRWLADARGVTGIVANGHAAEVSSLSREERRRALAADATAESAAGGLVFPPTLFMRGAQAKPEMARRHFSEIAEKAGLPIVVFEYPPASGIGYSPETLAELAEIPLVSAVKDWSN